jgi:hypothetical protein
MQSELVGIIKTLELSHPEVNTLREQSLALCVDPKDADQLLDQFRSSDQDSGNCQEYQAFCALCKAGLLDSTGELIAALDEANKALEEFRFCGNSLNEGLAHRFLGLIYFHQEKDSLAINELTKSIQIFKSCADNYGGESNYAKKSDCEIQIYECEKQIDRIMNPGEPVDNNIRLNSNKFTKLSWPTASIVYGVYDVGHASRVGKFVLEDDQIGLMSIETIKFDDKSHKIFNLRIGNQISINPNGEYRWLRVVGQSMNKATPVPIDQDDYVLVHFKVAPQYGNIVFASFNRPPTPAERAGVIKRYSREGLKSESTDQIEPIPLEEIELQGIVLAVAKAEEEDIPDSAPGISLKKKPRGQKQSSKISADEATLYSDLLAMARGDQELVDRLVNFEIEQSSKKINRIEAIQRAILHWRRQL